MKNTGFKACGVPLYVGDILASHCGYYKVTEREGEFWMVDCTREVIGEVIDIEIPEDELGEPFKLERDLESHWTKVKAATPDRPKLRVIHSNRRD